MKRKELKRFYNRTLCCNYNGRFMTYGRLIQILPSSEARKYLLEENWDFDTWLALSARAGRLLRQWCDEALPEPVYWDGVIDEQPKRANNHYDKRHCCYQGRIMRYTTLVTKLKREGVENYLSKAKEYLVADEEDF